MHRFTRFMLRIGSLCISLLESSSASCAVSVHIQYVASATSCHDHRKLVPSFAPSCTAMLSSRHISVCTGLRCFTCAPRPAGIYQPGSTAVLLATNGPQVHGLALADNATHLVSNLFQNLPPRDNKKGAKLYGIAACALQPGVAAAATNAGVALLVTQTTASRAVAGLPRVATLTPTARRTSSKPAPPADGAAADAAAHTPAHRQESGDYGEGADDLLRMDSSADPRCASVLMVVGSKLVAATFGVSEGDNGSGGGVAVATGTVALPLPVRRLALCVCLLLYGAI